MRANLFNRRRLRASYRNTSMDILVGLIEDARQEDDCQMEAYCRQPRFPRFAREEGF